MGARRWGFGAGAGLVPAKRRASSLPSPPVAGAIAWWDAADLSYLFQDSAGTTAAVANSPVGLLKDKSGNGLDLSAAAAARPTLRTVGGKSYLAFSGANVLALSNALLRITGNLTIVAAARKTAGSSFGGIATCQTSAVSVNAYEFRFNGTTTSANPQLVQASTVNETLGAGAAGETGTTGAFHVFGVRRQAGSVDIYVDATSVNHATAVAPTADGNSVFNMGNRNAGGTGLTGDIAGVLIYGSALSSQDIDLCRTYLAGLY